LPKLRPEPAVDAVLAKKLYLISRIAARRSPSRNQEQVAVPPVRCGACVAPPVSIVMTTPLPEILVREGAAVLAAALVPNGFRFVAGEAGTGSGGPFASGRFVRDDRAIEFHVRYRLGLVSYRMGDAELSHEAYMRRAGHWGSNRYPDFGAATADSFAALAHDLSAFCGDFVHGDGVLFASFAAAQAAAPDAFRGFAALR